uniref:hypothetical protein n=1 Tax=Nonomuraea pusilla TaxID=46177 RepID=UPI0006E23B32|nr:hypothetical protein [Nonomuraea pusilla]
MIERRVLNGAYWRKNHGSSQIVDDARQAHHEGRRIFVARLSADSNKASKGKSLPEVVELVEAIEAHGWQLDKMANSMIGNGFNLYENITCLFRRVD